MSFSTLKGQVLRSDLCARCGMCAVVCPEAIIAIGKDLRPQLREAESKCGVCDECSAVCPGADPSTPDVEEAVFGRRRCKQERWFGIFRAVYGGYAADPVVYAQSGSGGSTTALLICAFRELSLDTMLVAGRSESNGWMAAPALCNDTGQLHQYAQSTYQLSAYLTPLRELLFAEIPTRVGVVGLACHVQAIRKLQARPTVLGRRAAERIPFIIEIACSSNTLPCGTAEFLKASMGLDVADVINVRYREGDYPGMFIALMRNGERRSVPVWHVIRFFRNHKTHRCLACGDWLSGLADISIFDGDPNIYTASQSGRSKYRKHGTIIVRTKIGVRVIEAAVRSGKLKAWSGRLVNENLGLLRKQNRRCLYEMEGLPVPASPIPGFRERGVSVSDESFIPDNGEPDESTIS